MPYPVRLSGQSGLGTRQVHIGVTLWLVQPVLGVTAIFR